MQCIIVDLEATCWQDRRGQAAKSEIIELGAVRMDSATGPMGAEFAQFVRPLAHPQLSDFCRELTSIQQHDIDTAQLFPLVYEAFVTWAGPQPWLFCSWGDYDFQQLGRDCTRHGLATPHWPHVNLKQAFASHNALKPMGVQRALEWLGLSFQGTQHRGIDDARNIARIAQTIPDFDLV